MTQLIQGNLLAPAIAPPEAAVQSRRFERYLLVLGIALCGYALLGRGFAYFGIPPLYIGDILLLTGLTILLWNRGWGLVFWLSPTLMLGPLILWGLIRTLPYIREYGIDALRDAATWAYSLYAVVVAGMLLMQPSLLPRLLGWYRRFAQITLIATPPLTIIYRLFWETGALRWPWNNNPILHQKEGDILVHLAGILAFWASGVSGPVAWPWILLLVANAAVMGMIDRAGTVALLFVLAASLVLRPRNRPAWTTVAAGVIAVFLLWVSGFTLELPMAKGRELSFDQVRNNFLSTVSNSGNQGLDSNKEWRLNWWDEVVGYTFHGPYFWTGKGFGINLADDDGFQVWRDQSLRSPHSIHMTFLARMGVPGLVLWLALQASWIGSIVFSYLRARRARDQRWAGLFLFFGGFYVASLINASFDVYLEGPMGGIWFWAMFGLAAASAWVYRTSPEVLADS